MNEKFYNVRVAFHNGNPITLELKACGNLYIIPGREYFFMNAPINFINYLAQLKRCGITYCITNDSKGCYYSMDLTGYNRLDPRYNVARLRRLDSPVIEEKKEEPKSNEKSVVLSSDDFGPSEQIEESAAEKELNQMIAEDLNKVPEVIPEPEVPEIVENTPEPEEEPEEPEEDNGPKVYTEEQLSKFSKAMLLEISNDYGLSCSDINTKKEIRDAILEAQNK